MRATFDESTGATYIYIGEPRKVAHTYVCDQEKVGGMIHLDFDGNGKLVGIEIVNGPRHLPVEFLKELKTLSGNPERGEPRSRSGQVARQMHGKRKTNS